MIIIGSKGTRRKLYEQVVLRAPKPAAVIFETIEQVKGWLGAGSLTYTSSESKSRRWTIWRSCLKRQLIIVVGTRQAVLLPHLRTIILDEPDRYGYKNDQTPKYLTLTVALWRRKHQDLNLIIGGPAITCDTKLLLNQGDKLIGHGPTAPVVPIRSLRNEPARGDLIVVPSRRSLGLYPHAQEVHIGQVETLQGSWPTVWVFGFDDLLGIPDYNQQEKLYLKIQRLRWHTQKVYVLTQQVSHAVFGVNFIDEELQERRKLDFPPFARLMRIDGPSGETTVHKLPISVLPDKAVRSLSLPKAARINLDPLSIL